MAESNVESPMTGNVIEISVELGQSVQEGDLLIVIESMKMENEIFSEGVDSDLERLWKKK